MNKEMSVTAKVKQKLNNALWQPLVSSCRELLKHPKQKEFQRNFLENLRTCEWQPHPLYSVFTQYDRDIYLRQRDAFIHKYRCFFAVAKTIYPNKIIELGTLAGSSADAYLSAADNAAYTGIDTFSEGVREDDGTPWKPYEIMQKLFEDRGFKNFELIKADLRTLNKLPHTADLIVVDAAHDFDNEYADLKLALTANPTFIFVDDSDDENQAKPAIEHFLNNDIKGQVEYTVPIDYIGGGLVIKLRK